jgi:glutamate mutase epsilon subunit
MSNLAANLSEWERIRSVNAVRRQRKIADREAMAKELAENATPETLNQRKIRVVDELLERGKLTDEQRRAAIEINAVWLKITIGLFARVQRYERQARGVGQEDWASSMINAYHDRYIPWRDEAGAVAVKGQGNMTVADLVFCLAIDNYGVRQLADSRGMDQRTVLDYVRNSLQRYAEIGGWVDECGRSKLFA